MRDCLSLRTAFDACLKDTELRQERDRAVYDVYLIGLRYMDFSDMHDAADWVREQPAPKFFISPKALVNYIGAIQNGSPMTHMHKSTQEKINELYRLYKEYLAKHPDNKMSRGMICEILVEEPAPRFYIGHELTLHILQRERARHLREIQKRYKL